MFGPAEKDGLYLPHLRVAEDVPLQYVFHLSSFPKTICKSGRFWHSFYTYRKNNNNQIFQIFHSQRMKTGGDSSIVTHILGNRRAGEMLQYANGERVHSPRFWIPSHPLPKEKGPEKTKKYQTMQRTLCQPLSCGFDAALVLLLKTDCHSGATLSHWYMFFDLLKAGFKNTSNSF